MLAVFFNDEIFEKGKGRAGGETVFAQVMKKDRLLRRFFGQMIAEGSDKFTGAESGPEIKKDRGVQHFLRIRGLHPLIKGLLPAACI